MADERFTLTQEQLTALNSRRALDNEFKAFMEASLADRREIRAQVSQLESAVAGNTRTINEMHTALFAKDDDNEFGIAGLMVNMQKVVKHTEVVCNIARFFKWAAVSLLGVVTPALAAMHYLGWL